MAAIMPPMDQILLRTLISYLAPARKAAHCALIHQELLELLRSRAPAPETAKRLIANEHGYLGLEPLTAYLDAHGHQELFKIEDSSHPICALRYAQPRLWPKRHRQEVFKIIAPFARQAHHIIPAGQIDAARKHRDLDWFDFITRYYDHPESAIQANFRELGFIPPNSKSAKELVLRIAKRIDTSDPNWGAAFKRAVSSEDIFSCAIYMSAGFDPLPVFTQEGFRTTRIGSWMARLQENLETSAHARISFSRTFPTLTEILAMSLDELEIRIAGPNARQAKALARRKKREQNRQYFISRGLPLPDALKEPDAP